MKLLEVIYAGVIAATSVADKPINLDVVSLEQRLHQRIDSGFFWTDIASKQALVCSLKQLSLCLTQLPRSANKLLPLPAEY